MVGNLSTKAAICSGLAGRSARFTPRRPSSVGRKCRRGVKGTAPRHLPITVNIYYHGADGSARRFAEEMTASGTVDAIRAEPGNLRYEYFVPLAGGETVLLIDS